MGHTLTIRLTEELLAWLKETSSRTGVPVGRLVRGQLENARMQRATPRFMQHAGVFKDGPHNLSSRKGLSRG